MSRLFTRLGFTAVAIVAGGTVAHAQTATTGAVSGVISDKSGAPLAGANVRLSSTQTSRTSVTGADGTFRMGLLNPGTWTIEVTKPGFQKITQTLSVLVNQSQPVTFKMASEAASVVEVLGSTTTIDTTTTQTGFTTAMDSLAAIPKGRDMNTIALLTPGVASSGFMGGPSMAGASGAENTYVMDGLVTTNMSRGFQGAGLVTDFIDQVEIQTGGFKPEFSALGGVFNAVTKSGSNELKGSSWLTWDAIGIQAVQKKSQFAAQAPPDSRYDIGGELGGPIIKDKLFFFLGFDANRTEPQSLANLSGNKPTQDRSIDALQFVGKVNWYLATDHQLTFSAIVNDSKDTSHGAVPLTRGNANLGGVTKNTTQNLSLNYDWNISPSLFLSLKGGTSVIEANQDPDDINTPRIVDSHWYNAANSGAGIVAGGGFGAGPINTAYSRGGFDIYTHDKITTTQLKADLSWFYGRHNVKFGIGMMTSEYHELLQMTGGARYTISASGRTVTVQKNYTDATVKAEYQHIYAQDAWELFDGFKAYYGFRFEIQDQKDMAGKSFMKFDNFKDYVQPRIGITWDINKDGKSKLSASYGTYFEAIPQRMAIRVFANEIFTRDRYTNALGFAPAATGNYSQYGLFNFTAGSAYTYSPAGYGTLNGPANGSGIGTLATFGAPPVGTDLSTYYVMSVAPHSDLATPFSYDPIAEGTKLTQRQEWTLGFDQTLASGYTVGVHAKHRILKNPIEDSTITDAAGNYYDPGASAGSGVYFGQAILWNPGRYAAWTSRSNSGTPSTRFVVNDTLYDKAGNTYDSIDFTFSRQTERSSINFSYTWSRLEGNYEGLISSSNGQADANITASMDYYPYVGWGLLPLDRTHVVKVFGSRTFDLGGGLFSVGFNWVYQSGTPVSLFDNGSSSTPPKADVGGYGSATPQNGLLGQFGRSPATNNVDGHLDYTYKFNNRYKMIPSIDIFNVFNSRPAVTINQQATDATGAPQPAGFWGSDRDWQVGRRYRFGVKFQF